MEERGENNSVSRARCKRKGNGRNFTPVRGKKGSTLNFILLFDVKVEERRSEREILDGRILRNLKKKRKKKERKDFSSFSFLSIFNNILLYRFLVSISSLPFNSNDSIERFAPLFDRSLAKNRWGRVCRAEYVTGSRCAGARRNFTRN